MIGKDSRILISRQTIVSLVVTLALIIAMVPTIVLAGVNPDDDSDNITVTFSSSNGAPIVTSVTLYDSADSGTVTNMDPTVEYSVQVNVTDNNTLNDLTQVKVTIYYDADGNYNAGDVPTTADNQTCGIYTWTPGGGFVMDSSLSGSWTLETSQPPTLSNSSGVFKFHFKPGRVAKESEGTSEWHIHVVASDATQSGTGYQENLEMNWYGEMSITPGSVELGNVNLGETKQSSPFVVTYWSNGNYSQQVKALSATWSGVSNSLTLVTGTPGPGEFKLAANDENVVGEAVALTITYQSINDGGMITTESGNSVSTNYLWITLGTSDIPLDNYSGTVFYQILERN